MILHNRVNRNHESNFVGEAKCVGLDHFALKRRLRGTNFVVGSNETKQNKLKKIDFNCRSISDVPPMIHEPEPHFVCKQFV